MDLDILQNLLIKLKDVRKYLIKIGESRRKGEALECKIREAKELNRQYIQSTGQIELKLANADVDEEFVSEFEQLNQNFSKILSDILQFDVNTEKENPSISKMSAFDLKTAISLLPVMDDDEDKTRQLIDAIELYSSLISNDSHTSLITFVLKTRLSSSAKLRLDESYPSVKELITAMKSCLLTKKSDTALQNKMMRTKQGNKSIEDFGKELEQLFVDLTIAQADGNNASYKILKPINEKNAIKQFADGLRNYKTSTIIAARNFSSLKDAIRAAQDEELVNKDPGTSNQVMTFGNRGRRFYNQNKNFNSNRSFQSSRGKAFGNNFQNRNYFNNNSRGGSENNNRNYYSRGKQNYRGRGQGRGRVNFAETEVNREQSEAGQFFRD